MSSEMMAHEKVLQCQDQEGMAKFFTIKMIVQGFGSIF